MKAINSLKHIFQRAPKVEASIIKREPVNKQASLIIRPRPWWAEPIPEAKPRPISQKELDTLLDEIKSVRSHASKIQEKLNQRITSLQHLIATKDAEIHCLHQKVSQYELVTKKLTSQLVQSL
jgi:hypothetical protein